jgi:hypothetical protein
MLISPLQLPLLVIVTMEWFEHHKGAHETHFRTVCPLWRFSVATPPSFEGQRDNVAWERAKMVDSNLLYRGSRFFRQGPGTVETHVNGLM